jgi:hypothetical protein
LEEAQRLGGLTVLIRPDVTTTVRQYVNKGSGPSKMLTSIMKRIWTICLRHDISLRAEHFKSERMVGCNVDSLSRMAKFVLLREYFDPSATGKDLAIEVIVRVTQWTCMLQERHENVRRMLSIWEAKAPLVMLDHSS